ncbi:Hypothetical predicted protein [Octopus vulgaris]|uniref:Uncharacterized protein n=1 Tax=Octopus vulgaris TaxID=6645 RepID=A0AA36FI20_OCTVU|nr:Hypothetical predicted protein [Octopus vulgaris]
MSGVYATKDTKSGQWRKLMQVATYHRAGQENHDAGQICGVLLNGLDTQRTHDKKESYDKNGKKTWSVLFAFTTHGDGVEEKAAESDSEDESGSSGKLLEVIDPSGEIPMEVSQEPKYGRSNMTGSSISLVRINRDDLVNKDAPFLEKIQKMLDENGTSTLSLPYRSKLMSTISEAR